MKRLQIKSADDSKASKSADDSPGSPPSDGGNGVVVVKCKVDDLRVQWIRSHLKKMAYMRFSDLSSLIRKSRAKREAIDGPSSPRRHRFNGMTLSDFESECVRTRLRLRVCVCMT